MRHFTGIDVWMKWGIVTIDENLNIINMWKMPVKDKLLDLDWLEDIYQNNNLGYIAIEKVHALFGSSAKSTFNFWWICGAIFWVFHNNHRWVVKVTPREWQKAAWDRSDIVYKQLEPRKMKDTKATSLKAAQRIFPGVEWKVWRQRVEQDWLYDSALMAYWLLTTNQQQWA